jgi:hypothetical protein
MLQFFFACSHRRTTFPQTPPGQKARTYIVCLDCGQEFDYDWREMRVVRTTRAHTAETRKATA